MLMRVSIGLLLWLSLFGCEIGRACQDVDPLEKAVREFYSGDLPGSRKAVEAYLSDNPYDADAKILLARILAASGESAAAFDRLVEVLDRNPENIDALFFLSSLASALSQQEFARLYSQDPDSARVHQLMGQSFQARRQFSEAERELKAALEKEPKLYEAQIALGEVYVELGKLESAVASFEAAIRQRPTTAEGYRLLGIVLRKMGKDEAADVALKKAEELKRGRP